MITNDSSIIHYQDNGNEGFLGRLITGNDHSGHDHIHYLQRLPHDWDLIILSSPPNSSSKWSKTGKNSKNPVKIRYNFFLNNKLQKKFIKLTMHVLRSVCPNGSKKQMHLACLTPYPK
jgi:hypothetical protein